METDGTVQTLLLLTTTTTTTSATNMYWSTIIFDYVCPIAGVIISNFMYAAPVADLRKRLVSREGTLGNNLNPFPWVIMTGNCFGWLVYASYVKDPFILSSNIPGIMVSFYLNFGAAKLQYNEQRIRVRLMEQQEQQRQQEHLEQQQLEESVDNNDNTDEEDERRNTINNNHHRKIDSIGQGGLTIQEQQLLILMLVWAVIVVTVGWFDITHGHATQIFGICANINVIFFYGAPLQAMNRIIQQRSSNEIHIPTLLIGWINAGFWMLYGFAKRDIVIWGPNGVAFLLSVSQAMLCCIFPRKSSTVTTNDDDDDNEDGLMVDGGGSGSGRDIDIDHAPLLRGEN